MEYYLSGKKLNTMQLLDGKATAQEIREELRLAVEERKANGKESSTFGSRSSGE